MKLAPHRLEAYDLSLQEKTPQGYLKPFKTLLYSMVKELDYSNIFYWETIIWDRMLKGLKKAMVDKVAIKENVVKKSYYIL